MSLTQKIQELLDESSQTNSSGEQLKIIEEASKIYDDLCRTGLIEVTTYKLAPINSVPPKQNIFAKNT